MSGRRARGNHAEYFNFDILVQIGRPVSVGVVGIVVGQSVYRNAVRPVQSGNLRHPVCTEFGFNRHRLAVVPGNGQCVVIKPRRIAVHEIELNGKIPA